MRGRGVSDPAGATAGNFARAVPFAAVLALAMHERLQADAYGVSLAVISGGIASSLFYVLSYTVWVKPRAVPSS